MAAHRRAFAAPRAAKPGTILVDKDGVVRAKLFADGYKERYSTDELIKAAQSIK
jgi:hypothetical protein